MDLGLEGRTAIVCGASSGLGLAAAESLAREGANVAMLARHRKALEEQAERIGGLAVRGDVRNLEDLTRLVDTTVEAFGGIDIVLNNSGGPPPGTAAELDDEAIEEAVELLLLSVVRLARLSLPHLERSDQGRIVNIASYAVRQPVDEMVLSNAVRAGVIGWAKTLARELAPKGITVNSVAPGLIDTPRIAQLGHQDTSGVPLGRLGRPEEVGDVICFLASARASYITGAVIPVDGGATRSLL
jgi:3-oxoacyl-[acyl-carrier protein] reductase